MLLKGVVFFFFFSSSFLACGFVHLANTTLDVWQTLHAKPDNFISICDKSFMHQTPGIWDRRACDVVDINPEVMKII